MWAFFHGWRRKAGVVALGLALVFTGSWIRSRHVIDVIVINAVHRQYGLVCRPRGLSFRSYSRSNPDSSPGSVKWDTGVYATNSPPYSIAVRDEFADRIAWRWQIWGLDIGEVYGNHFEKEKLFLLEIPHHYFVLPMTLLSAYLILWKPRKRKTSDQPAISNLISN